MKKLPELSFESNSLISLKLWSVGSEEG